MKVSKRASGWDTKVAPNKGLSFDARVKMALCTEESYKRQKVNAGKLGAAAFWSKYGKDPQLRKKMRSAWQDQEHDKRKTNEAAVLGGKALWRRYHEDKAFRAKLDSKLRASRSRGGSISLKKLGEAGFKSRLNTMANAGARPSYFDTFGNVLRSSREVRVADILNRYHIKYQVEPRFVIGDHAFYPDFMVDEEQPRLIEVVGYTGDKYWDGTAMKVKSILAAFPKAQVAVVTSYFRIMRKRLQGERRAAVFRPNETERLVSWCRGSA